MTTPPFRAEHVGSLLHPESLRAARAAAEGDIYRTATAPLRDAGLEAIEDAAVREAVRLQEDAGLEGITDGEYRRRSWFQDFLLSLSRHAGHLDRRRAHHIGGDAVPTPRSTSCLATSSR
jgi:5-methyltetrahydropteroyltriglutamate--homocysteine methyltransferase